MGRDAVPDPAGLGLKRSTKALLPSGKTLGMRLYALPPGQTQVLYHLRRSDGANT